MEDHALRALTLKFLTGVALCFAASASVAQDVAPLTPSRLATSLRAIRNPAGLSAEVYLDQYEHPTAVGADMVFGRHCLVTDASYVADLAMMMSDLKIGKTPANDHSEYAVRVIFNRDGSRVFDAAFPRLGVEKKTVAAGAINLRYAYFDARPIQRFNKFISIAMAYPPENKACAEISN